MQDDEKSKRVAAARRHPVVQTLADNLVALMGERGMNPAQLRDAAGLNQTGVYDLLNGKVANPRIDTVSKLADALDVSVAELVMPPEFSRWWRELSSLFAELDEEDRSRLLSAARAWSADKTRRSRR